MVSERTIDSFLEALIREIELSVDFFAEKSLSTIYFGGGTPSRLDFQKLKRIITRIKEIYKLEDIKEITLEANPDDINIEYIRNIASLGINRISLGVQSFHDHELRIFNRSHNKDTAINSVKICRENGIENLSIDLIFGVPGSDLKSWKKNLDVFLDLDIDHLSCYNLTIEHKTVLYHKIKTGQISEPNEAFCTDQFLETIEYLEANGFEHYEISNYAKNGRYAVHNTNYWKGYHYLGLGPSAHSYNGEQRFWNIANTRKYIKVIGNGNFPREYETLSKSDKYNEFIMTGLRTMWGIDIERIKQFEVGTEEKFSEKVITFIEKDLMKEVNGVYKLTKKGKLFADSIASDLFIE